jgi:hypothetical protein
VWKKVCRIQREEGLWKPKEVGGIVVRDVRLVNISLLTKWRWRLIESKEGLWKDVLRSKYGDAATKSVSLGTEVILWYASTWWKNICSIGTNLNVNWFAQQVVLQRMASAVPGWEFLFAVEGWFLVLIMRMGLGVVLLFWCFFFKT